MRKLTLLITSLLCYVGVLHAEALVADGVYTLSADENKQRGELVAANEYDYPVLDGIDLSDYTQNSTAAKTNGQYWYVQSADASSNTYYIYNIAQGKFLVNENGNVNFGDTPYVWTFVTNTSKPAYLNIKDATKTGNSVWLSSGCSRTAAQRPVQWDSNNNDGGALYTFTYVGNYFATPETGKYYKIKGEGELPWVTANATDGGNVVVSANEADAAVFLKTANGLQAVATGKYLGYSGGKYTYSDTELDIELRNTGDYLANYSNKYAIVSGGNYMFNNNNDGIVHESSQGLDLPRLWAFTEVEAPEAKVATLAELQAALAADNELSIIITAQIEIPAGETVELDLNGKTVNSVFNGTSTTNHIYALSNKGTLTIQDSKGNGSINSRGFYNYGSLTLNAGAINAIDGNGGYAVNNQSGSTFVMNGGVVAATNEDDHQSSSGGYDATALKVPAGCTATLNGGTINNVCDFTYAIDAAGTLNIPAASTITVNGTHGAIYVSGGETTIDAGTFQIPADEYSRTDNVLYVSGGSLVVNGGTFIGDSDTASGGSCLYDAAGKAVVNGGTFKGSSGGDVWGTTGTTIKGGTFENLTEKQHIADGYEMNENGEVVEAVKEVKVATLAELQAALADNSSELPIIITETIVIPEGETVVLDLNGKTVTRQDEANQYALRNLGDLTIKDTKGNGSINARGIYNGYGDGAANVATAKITVLSGTINAKGTNGGAAVYNYGIAEIKGGTFTSIGGYSLNSQSGASMTIADGVTANNGIYVSGATLVVDGGEISGNRSGCHVLYAWNSTVTINGGEFYNNNSGNSTTMAAGTTELTINGGTFGIKDGRVPGNGNTWTSCLTDTQNSATMTVNGGTFNGGFRVQGGTTMTIAGGEFNDCYGSGYNIYGTAIVKGGTFTDDAAKTFAGKYLAENFKLNEEGSVVAAPVAAKIGETKYETLEAAFAAAAEDATITLLADATPALTSQRAITKAAEIDLGGYTLTLTEDDLYFGTIDFRNGNIVVDPSVKPSTAVFWMFKDQVLTFENVKLTATGVTGTYLIGLDGNNADLNLFSSEIIVDNTTALDLDIICVNASTGNDIWMEDSKVTVKNLDGRVFFRGNYTVAGNSEINLEGVTKAGFRIEAGQTLTIKDNAVVNIVGEPRDGGIHLTDASANYTKAETATVNATVNEPKVAKIGETTYKTLQAAIEAVQEGETIILVDNVNVTTPAYGQNALNHARAINFTLDLNGKTLSANTGNSVFRFNIANSGATSNVTLTIKNGKIVAGSNTWCAVMASGISADVKAIMNLENLTIESSKANDMAVKSWANATINAEKVTVNTTNAAGGFYAVGGEIVLDECTVNQKGLYTAPYMSMAFAVSSNGKMTINSGTYSAEPTAAAEGYNQGSTHGSWVGGVMNSGGELIINGGTFSNGNFGDDALATAARGLIFADSNGKVTVNGGTFNALKSIFDFQNNLGTTSPVITVKGGSYSANPTKVTSYGSIVLAAGYTIEEKDGRYVVEKGLAGAGTEADPYVVNDVDDLVIFRNSVNAGETKYNADGVYVALGADIDLAGEDWSVNIGDDCNATFDGIFDGKGHTISNLTATETAQKADGYVCTGLFGAIYGNAVVKNFTIENVNINTGDFTGNNAAAVVGFAYASKGSIENVTVKGDIQINAGKVTGTGAIVGYGYVSTMTVKKCQVIGNDGSAIIGQAYVGGIIGYSNKDMLCGNIVQNIDVTATSCATGGVAGIMLSGGQAADNTVKAVTLVSTHANWQNAVGVVVGTITSGSVTIANTIFEGVNTTAIAGAVHADKPTTPVAKVAARNGNVYYTTIDAAMQADGDDVEVFVPVNLMDGEEYAYEKNCLVGELTYTRTLPAVNKWYAFFVPFEMSINDLPANVEVAMINDFHTTFDDADGSIVRQWVEYIIKRRGTLKAGHPYLIRATSEDALEFTIELEDAVLKSAAEKTAVTVSSAITSVTFEGVYASTPSSDNTSMVRYMAVNGNGVWDEFTGYNLNPFRILMTYTVLDEDYAVKEDAARAIGVRVIGEEDENGETVIYDVEMDSHEGVEYIYDLQGRRVLEPQKGGLYIVNGKKVIF